MAVEKKKVIGMVAYHRHSKSRCEMKRLYVKPKYRENKLGKKLVECEAYYHNPMDDVLYFKKIL